MPKNVDDRIIDRPYDSSLRRAGGGGTTSSGGGATTFLALTDTPNSYNGADGYFVVVDEANARLILQAGGTVISVNGQMGVVVLDPDDLDDSATTNKFASATNIAAAIDAASEATAPLGTDRFVFTASSVLRWITYTNLLADLTTVFNGLYTAINTAVLLTTDQTVAGIKSFTDSLKIGFSAFTRTTPGTGGKLHVEQQATDPIAQFWQNTADALGAALVLGKSRGTAAQSNTVVQSGDDLGRIEFWGADGGGTTATEAARITAQVDGTPGNNDMPGRLGFYTTADGAASPTLAMMINQAQQILMGNDTANPNQLGVAGGSAFIGVNRYVASAFGAGLVLRHSRNTTVGSHTILQANDRLGEIIFQGSDGTAYRDGAVISAKVDATPGASDMPTRLEFYVTPDGSATAALAMVIKQDGKIGLKGVTTPEEDLHINGSMLINNGGFVKAKTVGGTSVRVFGLGADDIAYFGGIDSAVTEMRVRTAGVNRAVITNTGARFGDATAPAHKLEVVAGTSTNDAAVGGVLYASTTTVGNVGTGDDDLMTYTIPANTLAVNNQSIWFEAVFRFANNGNAKTCKILFGGTTLLPASGAGAATDLFFRGRIIRSGATTQRAYAVYQTSGSTQTGGYTTPAETLSGSIVIKGVGTATADDDITMVSFIVGFDDANT